MNSKKLTSLISFGRATLAVALLVVIALGPVWKNKEIRNSLQAKEKLNETYLKLQSQTATLEVTIERLSTSERLQTYALDSLGMVQPNALDIMAIERNQDGVIVAKEVSTKGFFKKLLGL